MAFRLPSLAEARDIMLALGRALFPDRNFGNPRSFHSRRATFFAAAMTHLHAHVREAGADAMPDTASDGDPINRWGTILGVTRKSATPARKANAGRVIGTAGTAVDAGEELVHESSGLRFQIARSTTVGSAESVDADIVAIDTGAQTRLAAGEVLRFVDTPTGLQTGVTLVLDLDEDGFDEEPFGAYRERILAALSEPTAGGTQADLVAWMLELEGVTSAYAYPNRAGRGTVDLVGLHAGSGTARVLSDADADALLAHVRELAPAQLAGDGGGLRHLRVQVEEHDVEIALDDTGQSSYVRDWDDRGSPPTVAGWTPATRLLELSARPSDLQAGHRIVIKGVASAQRGEELVVEALSGAAGVILEEAPEVDPQATDIVYSGGPLVTPIRDAIVAHMNGEHVYAGRGRVPTPASSLSSTVGLEVLTAGIGPANPGGAYGAWSGDLLRSTLYQIAMYKAGVRNADILAPAADVEASSYEDEFPDDDQIGLIAPGAVIVRYRGA